MLTRLDEPMVAFEEDGRLVGVELLQNDHFLLVAQIGLSHLLVLVKHTGASMGDD